jgi:hypothetical protein
MQAMTQQRKAWDMLLGQHSMYKCIDNMFNRCIFLVHSRLLVYLGKGCI